MLPNVFLISLHDLLSFRCWRSKLLFGDQLMMSLETAIINILTQIRRFMFSNMFEPLLPDFKFVHTAIPIHHCSPRKFLIVGTNLLNR